MEAFCNEIIAEIKMAKSETELIKVISNSISRFRMERNSFNERGYIMNMIVSLRGMNPNEEHSKDAINNINLAIAIFRQFQKQSQEGIF